MSKKESIRTLKRLHKYCKASERGFNTVANTVKNRGLKVLLKTYAQQRHKMANDLEAMIKELGDSVTDRRSLLEIIHRGRIIIVATLTVGPTAAENVALKEAMVGEKAALKNYQKALTKIADPDTKALIQNQYETIQNTSRQVSHLRGLPGERLVVRLFNSDQDVDTAIDALEMVGFSRNMMEVVDLDQTADPYEENNRVVSETIISGTIGGAIWGVLLGAVVGFSLLLMPGIQEVLGMNSPVTMWGLLAVSGLLSGALLGALLGFFIGLGVAGEDSYTYEASMERGSMMILLHTNRRRAPEASQIMQGVNLKSIAGQLTQ